MFNLKASYKITHQQKRVVDTIFVASVSAIYSIGSPDDFFNQKITYSLRSGTVDERIRQPGI
jgi:excinuclease UvrABC helicase subunit UvrB